MINRVFFKEKEKSFSWCFYSEAERCFSTQSPQIPVPQTPPLTAQSNRSIGRPQRHLVRRQTLPNGGKIRMWLVWPQQHVEMGSRAPASRPRTAYLRAQLNIFSRSWGHNQDGNQFFSQRAFHSNILQGGWMKSFFPSSLIVKKRSKKCSPFLYTGQKVQGRLSGTVVQWHHLPSVSHIAALPPWSPLARIGAWI